jgi:hypothetical protein
MRYSALLVMVLLLGSNTLFAADAKKKADPYDLMDTDKCGAVSRDDFIYSGKKIVIDTNKVIQIFPNMKNVERLNELEYRTRLFNEMDTDHNSLLSRDEWNEVAPNILKFNF